MTGKYRRTKGKDWNESSNDDASDDEDSHSTKKLKEISYVRREKEKKIKNTNSTLSKLCDSEDNSSDIEQKRLKCIRPMLPIIKKGSNKSCFYDSNDSSSDSSHTSNQSKTAKVNTNPKKTLKRKMDSSDSDSKSKKTVKSKKHRLASEERKFVSSKNISNKFELSHSDSSSSKEFQKPDVKKRRKSKSKYNIAEHALDDYSIMTTPSKSDDENIPVESKQEISLKHYIIEEVKKIQKMTEELKNNLEYQSDYFINKKINVVRDSKFIAHKILRIYDCTHEKIKANRKDFADLYNSWIDTCSSSRSTKKTIKNRSNLSFDEEKIGHNSSKRKSLLTKSLKNSSDSDNSDKSEKSEDVQAKDSCLEEKIGHNAKQKSTSSSKKSLNQDDTSDNSNENSENDENKKVSRKDITNRDDIQKSVRKSSKKNDKSNISETEENENEDKMNYSSSDKSDKQKSISLSQKSLKESNRSDRNDKLDTDEDEENEDIQKKGNSKKKSLTSSKTSSKENEKSFRKEIYTSDSEENDKLNSDESNKSNLKENKKNEKSTSNEDKSNPEEHLSKDKLEKHNKKKKSEQLHENDFVAQVSDCDSDEIFSGDETRSKKNDKKKNNKKKNDKEESVVEDETVETDNDEDLPKDSPAPLSKSNHSHNSSSEDLFETTASEVPNTPVKSPILSSNKLNKKTLLQASKQNEANEVDESAKNCNLGLEGKQTSFNEVETNVNINGNADVDTNVDANVDINVDAEVNADAAADTADDATDVAADVDVDPNVDDRADDDNAAADVDDNDDADAEDSERAALNKLLQDCDSDESLSSVSKENTPVADSDKSLNSSRSTEVAKKGEDTEKQPLRKSNKLLQKNMQLLMQTKKQNSISSDSSSDSAEENNRKKSLCLENGDDLPSRKRRRQTFNVQKNRHYKADKKLRTVCRVKLERLSQKVLRKYARALDKSKKYVANKKFHSITNLDGIETKRKSKRNLDTVESLSDNGNAINVKEKKKNKNEKKLENEPLDEDNNMGSDDEASDKINNSSKRKNLSDDIPIEQEVARETESKAKEALLHSCSSSDNEDENVMEVDNEKKSKETKNPKTKKAKDAKKDNSSKELSDEKSEDEKAQSDENDKKEKSTWKQDKLLTFHITDTESEEEKFLKSQEKKKAKNAKVDDKSLDEDNDNEKTPVKTPVKKKRKQRKTRRILDSDSEAQNNSSDESDASVKASDLSESEKEKEEKKKKKSRKRRQKSSESDSSSGGKKSKSKRRRIKKVATDSDSDNDQDSPGKGRKNIRKLLKDKHVADDTKKAAQDEEERLKRIAERQRLFNEMYDARLAGEAKVDKLVLDFDEETKEELVVVDEELVKRLKPHQAKGIKFMWDACFESLKQIEKSEGSGCIIAHCMGLGKTFQVVTLAHTLLTHEETGVKTVMVVCPLSTVLNWVNEFKTWLKHVKGGDEIDIYELTKMKKNIERKYQLESWQRRGGVLIIGYEMFRNLTSTGKKMRKAMQDSIMRSLVDPGADLVVCDEGHLLKNEESALSKAMKLVKTMRRVVLTGTPLQNNLKEYHCMVQFVKPNLLGTKKEFLNRFVNPITNGQFDDSTPYDVKLMKKRAHVLHKMLEGSVQRFDYSVLTPFLPPKQEYVIFVRLTEVQIKMYQHYLDNFARRFGQRNGSLFADFQELQRIWTHPYVLRLNAEKVEKANEKKRLEASDSEGSLKDFIDDDSDEDSASSPSSHSGSNSDVQCVDSDNEQPVKTTRSTRLNPKEEPVEEVPNQETAEEAAWWTKFVEEEQFEDLRISTKLVLLFGILRESEQIGDKVLVFSQSLYSLTLIEYFLNLIDQETQNGSEVDHLDKHSGTWSLGLDYFRLDGSTSAENRSAWCKIFNNPKNTRARLFLISTRAGGLGINLTAANRVIIFDASWNPSHDVQSIFRIYRFGQKKPCYVYRFLAAGTMEEKIYNRQVTKLSLACRVVDEQQIERHYSNNDLAELYQFDSYEDKSVPLNLPKDRLLAEIFLKYKGAVYNYHEHDSLLENKAEEELDEEERKQAWQEYEDEKQGKRQMINMGNMGFNPMMNMNSFPELESIKLLIQKDYPNLPPEHLETVARQAVYDMYRYVDQQAVSQMLNPYGAGQTLQPSNMLGVPSMQQVQPQTQQQQVLNAQSQLINMLNQPQINYAGTNHMPVYSGRGRPPKHMSMNNPMMNNNPLMNNNPMLNSNSMMNSNPMMNMRQLQTPLPAQQAQQVQQVQQAQQAQQTLQAQQVEGQQNSDEVEILADQVTPSNTDSTSNTNDIQEE